MSECPICHGPCLEDDLTLAETGGTGGMAARSLLPSSEGPDVPAGDPVVPATTASAGDLVAPTGTGLSTLTEKGDG